DNVSPSDSGPNFADLFEINELKAQTQEQDTVILKLKEKIKSLRADDKESKAVLSKAVSLNPIDPALLQVDAIPLVPKLRKNRTAHIDYLKHTLEEAATLRELVESERLLTKPSVATATSLNIDSNTHVLSSTRVALASSASKSKSKDNTKNNRIRRSLKKAKETKLEDHPRKVKSSLRKASVVDTRAISSEIKSVSNVNDNLKCASCNGCLFADNHDKCVVEYINSMNACRKSKSANTPVNRKGWTTTGKLFKTVGYKWRPTGRIFT
nr:hypothetical protein [Tanacetum cinerariifolium]